MDFAASVHVLTVLVLLASASIMAPTDAAQQQRVRAPNYNAARSTCVTASVCDGGALCRPLSPQPAFTHEVVAYRADGAYGSNVSEYALYDYSKVTAIADYSWNYANETICTAHKHGVRVLGFNMYDMGALHSELFYSNESRMNAWIETAARFTYDRGMDGIMLGEGCRDASRQALSL